MLVADREHILFPIVCMAGNQYQRAMWIKELVNGFRKWWHGQTTLFPDYVMESQQLNGKCGAGVLWWATNIPHLDEPYLIVLAITKLDCILPTCFKLSAKPKVSYLFTSHVFWWGTQLRRSISTTGRCQNSVHWQIGFQSWSQLVVFPHEDVLPAHS